MTATVSTTRPVGTVPRRSDAIRSASASSSTASATVRVSAVTVADWNTTIGASPSVARIHLRCGNRRIASATRPMYAPRPASRASRKVASVERWRHARDVDHDRARKVGDRRIHGRRGIRDEHALAARDAVVQVGVQIGKGRVGREHALFDEVDDVGSQLVGKPASQLVAVRGECSGRRTVVDGHEVAVADLPRGEGSATARRILRTEGQGSRTGSRTRSRRRRTSELVPTIWARETVASRA